MLFTRLNRLLVVSTMLKSEHVLIFSVQAKLIFVLKQAFPPSLDVVDEAFGDHLILDRTHVAKCLYLALPPPDSLLFFADHFLIASAQRNIHQLRLALIGAIQLIVYLLILVIVVILLIVWQLCLEKYAVVVWAGR